MEATTAGYGGRLRGLRRALSREEWHRAAAMAALIAALHAAGFLLLIGFVAPRHLELGDGAIFGIGLGLTAYALGMRHAFDADHIAAIDNVTRKLMAEGQRPLGVGFFFALGHASIVFLLAALFALGIRGLSGAVDDGGSALHEVTGVIGPTIAGTFLLVLGMLNLLVLLGIWGVFQRMRGGDLDERELERQLDRRGLLCRFLGRATRAVTKSWQMYPVGCLFGLGFDTATEIALLATAGTAAAGGLPFYAILCLPILFAAGMTLLDTLNGAFMNLAYGWAVARPIRRVFYNLTITALSVVVAMLIGTISLMSVLAERLELSGQPWDFVMGIDLNQIGYAIVVAFVLTWVLAVGVWRVGRLEERWTDRLRS